MTPLGRNTVPLRLTPDETWRTIGHAIRPLETHVLFGAMTHHRVSGGSSARIYGRSRWLLAELA